MRLRRLVPTFALLLVIGCSEAPSGQGDVPPWLADLIADFESQPPEARPVFIAQTDYQGRLVYYVPPRCCDVYGDLYDSRGTLLCHPDGGLTAFGDGRCPAFVTSNRPRRIIWPDSLATP